jgi:hypothetical protein
MKKSDLVKYIKEEIIDTLSEATPEEVENQKELNKELEKTSKLMSKIPMEEEFSEFKTYDDIIGGLIIRADAMKKYLSKNEPDLLPLADQLKAIITDLESKISGIDYASMNEEEDDNDDDAYQLAKAAKGKYKKLDIAIKALKDLSAEMKSLASDYSKADGVEKEKIKDQLKAKTPKKKELEALVAKLEKDVI